MFVLTSPNVSWRQPTVSWLSKLENFQPCSLPKMKIPNGPGNGVYESPSEYLDIVLRLWVAMTFVDGNNALLPHCNFKTTQKWSLSVALIIVRVLWRLHVPISIMTEAYVIRVLLHKFQNIVSLTLNYIEYFRLRILNRWRGHDRIREAIHVIISDIAQTMMYHQENLR